MSKFIVIEGLDGTGKTTQIELLKKHLEEKGEKVFATAEPTKTPTGKFLRQVLAGEISASPATAAALFLADRIEHNVDKENGIKTHINNGEFVICDRYYYSTFAYQGFETDFEWIKNMHYSCSDVKKPDLVLFLTMAPEKCVERITANRSADDIEIYENTEALTKISHQFDTVFEKLRDTENVVYVNADGTIDEVAERIRNIVDNYIENSDIYYIIKNLDIPKDVSVEITQHIDREHQHHCWFGGECARIKYKDVTFTLEAVGDVRAELYDLEGNIVSRVKDTGNNGSFYSEMESFLKNDKELENASITELLYFGDCNWWECYGTLPSGEFVDMEDVIDSSNLTSAIQEVIDTRDDLVDWLSDYYYFND